MALKRKNAASSSTITKKTKSSDPAILRPAENDALPLVIPISHECRFITPKAFDAVYDRNKKTIKFSEKLNMVITNCKHSGFEPAKTGVARATGKEFVKEAGITLKDLDAEAEVFRTMSCILEVITKEISKDSQDEETVLHYMPPYFESQAGNCITLKAFDSALYISHADTSTTALYTYVEAMKQYSQAVMEDCDCRAVFFEHEGRHHFYTPKLKSTLDECFSMVGQRKYPAYMDGLIFGEHLINVKVTIPDLYVSNPEPGLFNIRANMYLNQIRVIVSDENANGDNAKWSLRRMTSISNQNSRELDELM